MWLELCAINKHGGHYLYNIISTLYNIVSTLYNITSTLYNIVSTLYNTISTLYNSMILKHHFTFAKLNNELLTSRNKRFNFKFS